MRVMRMDLSCRNSTWASTDSTAAKGMSCIGSSPSMSFLQFPCLLRCLYESTGGVCGDLLQDSIPARFRHINSDYGYHTESYASIASMLAALCCTHLNLSSSWAIGTAARQARQIQWGAQGWRFNHIHTVAPYSLNAQHHAQSDSVTQHRWGSPGPS